MSASMAIPAITSSHGRAINDLAEACASTNVTIPASGLRGVSLIPES
jgi:hypothetical protein